MIPKISSGSSFKGAYQYYLHDKGRDTSERVDWTHTENLLTDDPAKAWKVMAYTVKEAERLKEASGQKRTGRKLAKPVFTYSLAWHPEQTPSQQHMLATARKSLGVLGLADHEIIIVAHRDVPHKHVHVIVNRVHPLTGLAASTSNSRLKLSEFAREYEREHGKIYCPQREKNHLKRNQGQKTRYCDPAITQAWAQSDTGKGFAAALLEKGYHLAQGRKRLVVVDPYGQTHNPTRHLEGVRAKDFQNRIRDLDAALVPDATNLARDIQAKNKKRYFASLKYDEWAAAKQNQLQDRQIEQRSETVNRYYERLEREKVELERSYGLKKQKNQIDALQAKVRTPSLWKRILGISKLEQTRLQQLKMTYENAEWRTQERLKTIETEKQKSLSQLQEQQLVEKRRELELIANRRPSDYAAPAEREKIRQHFEKKQQHQVRQRPSLGR